MTDNKLNSIFNSLSGVEKRAMTKLLNSPFFTQNEAILRLWSWLLEHSKGRKPKIPGDQVAFKAVFPNAKFNGPKWRHLQSQLIEQIEQLLAQRAFNAKPLLSELELIPTYRAKNLHQALPHLFRRADQQLAKLPKDREYYHLAHQLELEKFLTVDYNERGAENNLAKVGETLDVYIIASKLRMACVMESRRTVDNVNYDASFLPFILEYLKTNPMLDYPVIALYYYCYQALTTGTEADFQSLRIALANKDRVIPMAERQEFLLLAINFCIKKLNSGQERYVREAFDLYQTGLSTASLIQDGYLSRYAYKNIVALGLRLKEFDWVEAFIFKYSELLKAAVRDSNRNYNLARLYFTKKEFNKAMPMLAQIDDNDLLLNLDSRVMLLKMYFETGEYDALDNLLTSFRILLLRKKKVIGYHQQHYLNMLRYTKKMMKLNRYDREAVAKFKKEVAAHKGVIEKAWMVEWVSGL